MKNSSVYKSFCVVLIYLIITQFLGIIGVQLLVKTGWYDIQGNYDKAIMQIIAHWEVIGFILLIIIILLVCKNERKQDERLALSIPKGSRSWIWKGILLVFAAQILGSVLDKVIFQTPQVSENTSNIISIAQISPISIFSVVILAPFVEELIFRYAIMNVLTYRLNTLGSILIAAFIFSVIHMDFPFVFGYFLIGIALAIVYVKSNRLLVSFIVHASMNLFVVINQIW
ncbi:MULTISPECIES: CPBP family intramembrane glutamic endopeptidase [unclassified Bacillus (in: firmicutes)]|uniref:CPBP family intramembrane glutamic endopeptidase n=1 Tax=unclassified Bacillus (in: firmicutes) TaxID=185979 RepID=UPI000BF4B431|nr:MULTISPECIES: CPBP family intramembrane glutamic endopeptidase [unclassified Bacillus (in: firmicutes)]PEU18585.1 CPBP family intramembrane metalloprotease [Bacillus sp. AFS014408]PFW63831.1 CPBP family intramembrane metalloprotease [Bacillus sp. AFS075034]